MSALPKFERRHVAYLLVFLALFFPALYFFTITSSSYEAALSEASTSSAVTSRIGEVSSIRFRFWDGFEFVEGTGGKAHFTFAASGPKGEAIVDIRLRNRAAHWEVESIYVR